MASITCPNCQTVTTADAASCPSCGNALSGVSQASSIPPSTPPASPGAAKPQIQFDWKSISHVDRLVGGGTLVLLIALFLPWFSFAGIGFSGTTSHGYLWIVFIVALAILALLAAEVAGIWKLPASSAITRDQFLLIGTAINFVLVLIAFLLKPGGYGFHGVGWDFGAFIGLVAAVVAVFPLGWPIIQARRSK